MAGPELTIHIDGGSRGNPGPAAVGIVIRTRAGQLLHEGGYHLGKATNNVAEYQGLLRSLDISQRFEPKHLQIFSDSELMVRQITGEYRVKSPDLKPLFEQAQMQLLALPAWQIQHVKREENKRADELVNMALDQKRDVIVTDVHEAGDDEPNIVAEPVGSKQPTCDAWTAQFCDTPSLDCPAPAAAGEVFTFGPTTPGGVCVYAANIILEEGPLEWRPDEVEGDTFCPRCKVRINLMRKEQ